MATSSVDISNTSHDLLRELAERTGLSTSEVIDKALDTYRRRLFFDKLNESYAELRSHPEAWAEFHVEQQEWEAVSMGELHTDEHWNEDGRCEPRLPELPPA